MRLVSVAPPYVIALLLLGVETPAVAQATASPVQRRMRELMMAEEQSATMAPTPPTFLQPTAEGEITCDP